MKPLDVSPLPYAEVPTIQRFLRLIADGFENPEGLRAQCQFVIQDTLWPYAITVEFDEQALRFSAGVHPQPQATLLTSMQAVARILAENTRLDFRSQQWARMCRTEGNVELLFMLLIATLRPTAELAEQYRQVTERRTDAYRVTAVERYDRPAVADIEQAVADGRPMVATGFEMPIPYRDWSLELLEQRHGAVQLFTNGTKQMTVADFVAKTRDADPSADQLRRGYHAAYTAGCVLPMEMRADFLPALYAPHQYRDPQLWFGAVAPHVPATKLHRDPRVAFLYQVMGRKRFRLYAPDQAAALYVMRAYNKHQRCWVWPEAPDYDRYPAFREAQPVDVCIEPGDLLVLPIGWFHAVYCLDSPTLSITYFLKNPALPEDLA